jgi:phosphohistidine phosphatase
MKTLTLIRHGKSSWKDSSLQDLDRPLNRRGKNNSETMGERLLLERVVPKKIYSSPAARATETAMLVAEALGLPMETINIMPSLYTFNYEELLGWVKLLDRHEDGVGLVCHNPAITDLVNFLTLSNIEKIYTCGVVVLKLNIVRWGQLGAGMADIIYYDYPKNNRQAS